MVKEQCFLTSLHLRVEQLNGERLDAALPSSFPHHQHLLLFLLLIQNLSPSDHSRRFGLDLLCALALLRCVEGVNDDFLESFADFCHLTIYYNCPNSSLDLHYACLPIPTRLLPLSPAIKSRILCVAQQKISMEESIYNIIPKQYAPPAKEPLYRSKFPPNIKPTGSTFCNHTTSKPIAANLGGEFDQGLQAHTEYAQTKTFGHLKGDRKPQPNSFLKKNIGTMGNQTLPPVRNFSYDCSHKKAQVPKVTEKPVLGLKSNKNFIVTNAIENILSNAKKSEEPVDWTKKKNYGEVPDYLHRLKENIQSEYQMIQNLHARNSEEKQCLSQEEVAEIREGLKRKWDEINRDYQKITHIRLVDTTGLKRRKEGYEKELAEIEADIKKLNKLYVFVD